MIDAATAAARALACLDLTNLDDACDAAAIDDALPPRPRRRTGRSPRSASGRASSPRPGASSPAPAIRIATVVNFPAGDGPAATTPAPRPATALADGADEIDLVVPWRALGRGPPGGGRRDGARDQGHLRAGDAQGHPRDRRARATRP